MEITKEKLLNASIEELKALKEEIEKVLTQKYEERLDSLCKELKELSERTGISQEVLVNKLLGFNVRPKKSTSKRKIPYIYRHPTDPNLGWTGRGMTPRWMQEWEASGRSREELRIK